MRRLLGVVAVAFGLTVGAASVASANIDLGLPTITQQGPGVYSWDYSVLLTDGENIDTSVNSSFLTLYDVNGLIANTEGYGATSLTPASFSVTSANTGPTPGTQNPPDSASIPNVTVTYDGTSSGSGDIGTLSFDSDTNNETVGYFSGQATLSGQVSANTASTYVPGDPVGLSGTPEPGSLVLLGSGLAGLVAFARRKK